MYFVDWYEQCGTVVAWYEQHGVNSCLCFVFRGSYGKKIEFWYDQCSHGQTAFCSYVLGQIASYLQKVICGEEVQFWSIKTSIPCIFYSCSNFYLKKREGVFLVTTICPLFLLRFLNFLSPLPKKVQSSHWKNPVKKTKTSTQDCFSMA